LTKGAALLASLAQGVDKEEDRMKATLSAARHLVVLIAAATLAPNGLAPLLAQAPDARQEARNPRLRAGDIDTDLSRVFIFVDKTGFGHQHGVVGRLKEGNLRIARESAGRIVFDMPSFRADVDEARRRVGLEGSSSESEQEQVTANMLGDLVLDVQRFPTAKFVAVSARRLEERDPSGNARVILDGDFTLHGVTHRIQFTTTATQERGYLHLRGRFPLRQTDFGIRPFRKALGAVGVADVLTVHGDLWIKQ
jgi:polyisoprenoid-binding protein YceI